MSLAYARAGTLVTSVEQLRPHQDYVVSEGTEFLPPKSVRSKAAPIGSGIPSDGRSRLLRNVKNEIVFGSGGAIGGGSRDGGNCDWHSVLRGKVSLEQWQRHQQHLRGQ
eukprot:COSAG02_NODE_27948_length_599_cov_1.394000_1_plen_108_part_10